ncbi:SPW repeat protein [Streptomonospora sp. S1-112]|uniref:SPW repeat protein n=1 Tax=Streptomonospora mangrovi TaxID=2883123 RepID=A0A9X3NM15_9ACTN|nr:SPW repeat protein [Streptomonospora mangrovi]MDA0562985.1 SPW repeat protein [Streptomonospora mangrovi]
MRRAGDWLVLVAGCAVAVSQFWHQMIGLGMVTLFLLGTLLVFLGTLSVIHPQLYVTEAVTVLTGIGLIALPWIFDFVDTPSAAWTSWIAGAIAVVVGAVNVGPALALYRKVVPPQAGTGQLRQAKP